MWGKPLCPAGFMAHGKEARKGSPCAPGPAGRGGQTGRSRPNKKTIPMRLKVSQKKGQGMEKLRPPPTLPCWTASTIESHTYQPTGGAFNGREALPHRCGSPFCVGGRGARPRPWPLVPRGVDPGEVREVGVHRHRNQLRWDTRGYREGGAG